MKNYIVSPSEFEIIEKIGYGSKSIVYKGKYKYIEVAIKKISLEQTFAKQVKHIISEILMLSKLRHPNIISLLAVAIDD